MRIAFDQLSLGPQLGAGSQGAIFRVHGAQDLGFPFPLIYKEFSASTVVSGASLEVLAGFRSSLDDGDRRVLDLRTVWPCAVVVKGTKVAGYVMQCIPDSFMQRIESMSGAEVIPREVQHLFVADAIARRNLGEVPKRTERLALARQAAFVLGFLHKRDFVFGDFSYKNAVYTLRPRPMVMLLDCDAVRLRGQGAAVPQLNSPGWGAPEKGPQTIESDRYKLGLFILRCLTPGINAQNRDPQKAVNVLDDVGLALLRRSLSADPKERTAGKEWVTYLDARIEAAGGVRPRTHTADPPAAPPTVGRAAPAPPPPPTWARGTAHPPPRPASRAATPAAPAAGVHLPPRPPAPVLPTSVVKVPRSRPFGQPKGPPAVPPGSGWVHPQRVATGHVRAALPAGGSAPSWTSAVPGAGPTTPPARPRTTAVQVILVLSWFAVVAFVVVAALFWPRGGTRLEPPATVAPKVTALAVSPTVPGGRSVLADSAARAAAAALAAAPPGSQVVRVRTGAGPAAGADGTLAASRTWTIAVLDPTTVVPGQVPQVQQVVVRDGAVVSSSTEPVPLGDPAPIVPAQEWPDHLQGAVRVIVAKGAGLDTATAIELRCAPAAASAADCVWIFVQTASSAAPRTHYTNATGTAVVIEPDWIP